MMRLMLLSTGMALEAVEWAGTSSPNSLFLHVISLGISSAVAIRYLWDRADAIGGFSLPASHTFAE